MKQLKTSGLLVVIILCLVTAGYLALSIMSCDGDTTKDNGNEPDAEDLEFSVGNITVIIDASVVGKYSAEVINEFKEWIEWFSTLDENNPAYNSFNHYIEYINSKDEFKVYLKPLIADNRYEIINDKEVVVNSNFIDNGAEFFSLFYDAIGRAWVLYSVALSVAATTFS